MATCSIYACDRPVHARGYCHAHYTRYRLHGDVAAENPIKQPPPPLDACIVPDCPSLPRTRGYCNTHYGQWWKHGKILPPRLTFDERFWSKVARSENADECWLWQAACDLHGYGKFFVHPSRQPGPLLRFAHRVAYELLIGPIPANTELDHLCRQPACVNPHHLEPVSHAENVRRGTAPAATALRHSKRIMCRHGHLYTPENTRYDKNGGRVCKRCNRARASQHRERIHRPIRRP